MRNVTIGAIALALAAITQVRADEIDKKTRITVNETILIPGKTLPPGKYVIKLMRSTTSRNIVQIFNDDENQLQATILAINNYRLTPTDKTVLRYWETPSGSPPALRAWFSPGDQYGQEFAYPKEIAERLARENNNATVPFYETASKAEPSASDLATVEVKQTPSAADEPVSPAAKPVVTPPPAPPVKVPKAVVAQVTPQRAETVLAQNEPPSTTNSAGDLPQTAGSLGWVFLVAIVSLLLATAVRFTRTA